MSWDVFIQILKGTFTFDIGVDGPGITFVILSFITNILTWSTPAAIDPVFTYIMTFLAAIYFVVKIRNGYLIGKGINLDNQIKKKNLESNGND